DVLMHANHDLVPGLSNPPVQALRRTLAAAHRENLVTRALSEAGRTQEVRPEGFFVGYTDDKGKRDFHPPLREVPGGGRKTSFARVQRRPLENVLVSPQELARPLDVQA